MIVLALGFTGAAAVRQGQKSEWQPLTADPLVAAPPTVLDAQGRRVASADYRRIVICHGAQFIQLIAADERIAGVAADSIEDPATAWCFRQIGRVLDPKDSAQILAFHPDLLIVHRPSTSLISDLSSAGCSVFDPGEVTDFASMERACRTLGDLLQAGIRTHKLIAVWRRRYRILNLHAMRPGLTARQTFIAPAEEARIARLRAALALIGLTLVPDHAGAEVEIGTTIHTSMPGIHLAASALRDPLGSDLLDVATAVRTQLPLASPPS